MWGILGSFLLGLIVSIIRHYRIPVLAQVATAYIELSRNTPLLIQLFFLYFGLPRIGIVLSSEVCATLGLVFLGGSYMAESFRSGLEAISQTQQEIGLAIGLTPLQVFRYVVLPQATAVALPSFSAHIIFLIKETSENLTGIGRYEWDIHPVCPLIHDVRNSHGNHHDLPF